MINVVIIEDERLAVEKLRSILYEVIPDVRVATVISSVQEGIQYFSHNPSPDLIFCDIHLTDGLSFEVFNRVTVDAPVIFATAYDEFIMKAFDYNGIDYLLKPVSGQEVFKAYQKYRSLQLHFNSSAPVLRNMMQMFSGAKKSRIIAKRGVENIALRLEDIVLFYTENKIVFLLDKNGSKYVCDRNLAELDTELDKDIFFRANRKYILNINFIKSYRSFEKVKLLVDLAVPAPSHQVVVSQETAPEFKRWLSGEWTA
jgi:DNA-binding LytR/AlgR family response regulator